MANRTGLVVVMALAGCSFSGKLNGTGPSGTPTPSSSTAAASTVAPTPAPSGGGKLIVPSLIGQTAAQAEATLRAAGFTIPRVEIVKNYCAHDDDTKMVAKDTVCEQEPRAGREHQPRILSLRLTLERDTYEHGLVGHSSEWRRMPDLDGKPLDVARTILARASLPLAEQFDIVEVDEAVCQPAQICRTEPAARARKVLWRKGRIYVGKVKPAAPPTAPTPAPGDTFF